MWPCEVCLDVFSTEDDRDDHHCYSDSGNDDDSVSDGEDSLMFSDESSEGLQSEDEISEPNMNKKSDDEPLELDFNEANLAVIRGKEDEEDVRVEIDIDKIGNLDGDHLEIVMFPLSVAQEISIEEEGTLKIAPEYYRCDECGQKCANEGSLGQHKKNKHNPGTMKKRPSEIFTSPAKKKRLIQSGMKKQIKLPMMKNNKFQCKHCTRNFWKKSSYEAHLTFHSMDRPYECEVCLLRFPFKFRLKKHMLTHSTESSHPCHICFKVFTRGVHLKAHLTTHYEIRPHLCNYCGKGFVVPGKLAKHLEKHSPGDGHVCYACDAEFIDGPGLLYHMNNHEGIAPFKCDECPQEYYHKDALIKHKRSHIMPKVTYTCEHCQMVFHTNKAYREHLKSHRPPKPEKAKTDKPKAEKTPNKERDNDNEDVKELSIFEKVNKIFSGVDIAKTKCAHCKMIFETENKLSEHIRLSHTNIAEPFICHYCGRKFANVQRMKHHRKIHEQQRTHMCPHCDKGFKTPTHLKNHVRRHSDHWAFPCPNCLKGFHTKGELDRHIIVHKRALNYECDECDAAFSTAQALGRHILVHSNARNFVCRKCHQGFVMPDELIKHSETCTTQPSGDTAAGADQKLQINLKQVDEMEGVEEGMDKDATDSDSGSEEVKSGGADEKSREDMYQCPYCDKWFNNGGHCAVHIQKKHIANLPDKLKSNLRNSKDAGVGKDSSEEDMSEEECVIVPDESIVKIEACD